MVDSTLYLNVDPIPDPDLVPAVIKAAQACFAHVVANTPQEPSFPKAVKWCWSQPQSEFFFHLEDDWVLKRPFDLNEAIEMLETRSSLSCVNLRLTEGPSSDLIFLRPGLFRSSHMRVIAGRLSTTSNPEQQLRPIRNDNPEGGKHLGFFGETMPQRPILKDTGRAWLTNSGYKKNLGPLFTAWVEDGSLCRLES